MRGIRVADLPSYPGAPRWLRIFGIAVGVVTLLLVALMHASRPHHNMFVGGVDHSAARTTQGSSR
jgi:hypothetical protein